MSADRLSEIRARLDAATPGPWEYQTQATDGWFSGTARAVTGVDPRDADHRPCVAHGYDDYGQNSDLIAHAPADIAWLLDRVEALEYVVESQRIKPLEHDPTAKRCRCIVCHRTEVAP